MQSSEPGLFFFLNLLSYCPAEKTSSCVHCTDALADKLGDNCQIMLYLVTLNLNMGPPPPSPPFMIVYVF